MKLDTELKRRLRTLGLSQKELAQSLGVTHIHVNRIANSRANPSPRLAREISRLLQVPFENLFRV